MSSRYKNSRCDHAQIKHSPTLTIFVKVIFYTNGMQQINAFPIKPEALVSYSNTPAGTSPCCTDNL